MFHYHHYHSRRYAYPGGLLSSATSGSVAGKQERLLLSKCRDCRPAVSRDPLTETEGYPGRLRFIREKPPDYRETRANARNFPRDILHARILHRGGGVRGIEQSHAGSRRIPWDNMVKYIDGMPSAVNPSPRTRPVYVLEFIWRKKCLRAAHCTRRAVRMLPPPPRAPCPSPRMEQRFSPLSSDSSDSARRARELWRVSAKSRDIGSRATANAAGKHRAASK